MCETKRRRGKGEHLFGPSWPAPWRILGRYGACLSFETESLRCPLVLVYSERSFRCSQGLRREQPESKNSVRAGTVLVTVKQFS